MNKKIIIGCIALNILIWWTVVCHAKMQALVIGNAEYKEIPLTNPQNDAKDMAAFLKNIGFHVTMKLNVTQKELEEAIRIFTREIQSGDITLFYFSGHGVQVNGINYLLPVDIQVYSEDEIKYQATDIGLLLDKLQAVHSQLNIIILDACRNNPFKGFRSINQGLASMSAPTGTFIAYATAPGKVAYDNRKGRNSPYTKHLLNVLEIPGLKVEEIFKQTRIAVMKETNNKQVSWESSSLIGDFYFNVKPKRVDSFSKINQIATSTPTPILESIMLQKEEGNFISSHNISNPSKITSFILDLKLNKKAYKKEEKMVISVKSDKDCHLILYNTSTEGEVTQIFPNKYAKDNFLKKGMNYQIPDKSDDFDFISDTVPGTGQVRAVCTSSGGWVEQTINYKVITK